MYVSVTSNVRVTILVAGVPVVAVELSVPVSLHIRSAVGEPVHPPHESVNRHIELSKGLNINAILRHIYEHDQQYPCTPNDCLFRNIIYSDIHVLSGSNMWGVRTTNVLCF